MARWKFWARAKALEREAIETGGAGKDQPQDSSRAAFLRKAAAGLAGVVGGGIAAAVGGSRVAKSAPLMSCEPLILGKSGDPSPCGPPPNLAEHATEVQFDGAASPGVVFLAQADNTYVPSATGFPAALAGWTSTNPVIPTGVYGYSEHNNGSGVVGWSNSPPGTFGVGGAFIGRNRAPLNLHPEMMPPPPTGQAGDLYVTINVDSFATLWFHTGVLGWKQIS